tara:strand:+ start:2158 stop:2328 length:171 start_codon:yes stop_codon:yes gene_type:complete
MLFPASPRIDLNDNNDIDMDEFIIYRSEATAAGKSVKDFDQKAVKKCSKRGNNNLD